VVAGVRMWKLRGMRLVVYGAGAIGGAVGARLHQSGHEVLLIARGAQLEAIRQHGLRLLAPDGEDTLRVPVVDHPTSVAWRPDDVVILAMKSQDTPAALDALASVAPPGLAVVCAQNGVDNERAALRRFARVYGMLVVMPASYLEPGVVEANGTPLTGILDLGVYPAGADERAGEIAAVLESSSFSSRVSDSIMRWKYRKLLSNLGNSVEALCGSIGGESAALDLYALACAEGEACLDAAGIDCASAEEDVERRGDLVGLRPVAGRRRLGGSTWQSLRRGSTSVETDHLNGEIVLLGRLHGVPTPANELLQRRMWVAVREGIEPGSEPASELLEELGRLGAGEAG
jgi:2-dehydropantoate 2-reductase